MEQSKKHSGGRLGLSLCVIWALSCLALWAAEDVSGDWDLRVETSQGTATPSISLRQQGEKITGTYRGRMGEAALEGTIREGSLRFSVRLSFQDREYVVTYTGKVEGNTMSGTVQFGDAGPGKWTASRKAAR